MSLERKNKIRKYRRAKRVRASLNPNGLPRVSVFRSLKYIYAQVIDDSKQATLTSCSSFELKDVVGDKTAIAKAIGLELAARALGKGITKVAFDRGSYLYHGRVKALAEGLREGGLIV